MGIPRKPPTCSPSRRPSAPSKGPRNISTMVSSLTSDPLDSQFLSSLARLGAKAFAHRLGVSERTLRRRLNKRGFSVRDLLVVWRRRELRQVLLGDMPLTCVCEQLGFASPPSLCRFVHREFGDSPGRLRCRLKEEATLETVRRPTSSARWQEMTGKENFGRRR